MTTTQTRTQAEADVRAFARQYPGPNALRAVTLCESGRLAWEDVAALFARSLASALTEARASHWGRS